MSLKVLRYNRRGSERRIMVLRSSFGGEEEWKSDWEGFRDDAAQGNLVLKKPR